jgi:hypothetical protein
MPWIHNTTLMGGTLSSIHNQLTKLHQEQVFSHALIIPHTHSARDGDLLWITTQPLAMGWLLVNNGEMLSQDSVLLKRILVFLVNKNTDPSWQKRSSWRWTVHHTQPVSCTEGVTGRSSVSWGFSEDVITIYSTLTALDSITKPILFFWLHLTKSFDTHKHTCMCAHTCVLIHACSYMRARACILMTYDLGPWITG